VQGGQTEAQAHETLKGTVSSEKNEILFQRFQINYDRIDAMYRKGTTLVWDDRPEPDYTKSKAILRTLHVDIIGGAFWKQDESRSTNGPSQNNGEKQVWQQQCRLVDTNGLGRRALEK